MRLIGLLLAGIFLVTSRVSAQYIEVPRDTIRVVTYTRGPIVTTMLPITLLVDSSPSVIINFEPPGLLYRNDDTSIWDPRFGAHPGRGLNEFPLFVENTGRAPGVYDTKVRIRVNTSGQIDSVLYQVTVLPSPPMLELAPALLTLHPMAGATSGLTNLLIHNSGTLPLTFSVNSHPAWLLPELTGGSLDEDSTASVVFRLFLDGLPPGSSTGSIELSTNDSSHPIVTVPVQLPMSSPVVRKAPWPDRAALEPASEEPCPADTFSAAAYIGAPGRSTRAESLSFVYRCLCPNGEAGIDFDRRNGTFNLYSVGGIGRIVTSDTLHLAGTSRGIPFTFETRLDVSGSGWSQAVSYLDYYIVLDSRMTVSLGVSDSPMLSWQRDSYVTRGAGAATRLVRLVTGYPGDALPLKLRMENAADYQGKWGSTQSNMSVRLRFDHLPPGAYLESCRALPLPEHAVADPHSSSARIAHGSALLIWHDAPPGHSYWVDRSVSATWQPVTHLSPDAPGNITFSDASWPAGAAYRLVVDGVAGPVIVPTPETTDGIILSAAASWDEDHVTLHWESTLPGLGGTCERRAEPNGEWISLTSITMDESGTLTVVDRPGATGLRYSYRLTFPTLGSVGEISIVVPSPKPAILAVALYPGSTSGLLHARVSISGDAPASLGLFDVAGHLREALDIAGTGPGPIEVDFGRRDRLVAGIYFARLEQAGHVAVARGVLVR